MSHFRERERRRCLQILELGPSASDEDIRKAYRAGALKFHPDKNQDDGATKKFQEIQAAYKYLTEGDSILNENSDPILISIFKQMFPWMFARETYTPSRSYTRPSSAFQYGSSSDDDEENDMPYRRYYHERSHTSAYYYRQPVFRNHAPSESSTSEQYRRKATFNETSQQHGQYFQETRAAKKRNRNAKRAEKLRADEMRAQWKQKPSNTDNRKPGATESNSQKTGEGKKNSAQPNVSRETTPSSAERESPRNGADQEESTKKSKKDILREQKQREREIEEIRTQLEQQEKINREKMEKKRAAQEEKERLEREAREEEERERQEENRRIEEEKQRQWEVEEIRRQEEREAKEKKRKLMAMFDDSILIDETGDFKYTDPDICNIIRRDDLNSLGDAHRDKPTTTLESINGLTAEDLIKLQSMNLSGETTEIKSDESKPESPGTQFPSQTSSDEKESKPANQGQVTYQTGRGQYQNSYPRKRGGFRNNFNSNYPGPKTSQQPYQEQYQGLQQPYQYQKQPYQKQPYQHRIDVSQPPPSSFQYPPPAGYQNQPRPRFEPPRQLNSAPLLGRKTRSAVGSQSWYQHQSQVFHGRQFVQQVGYPGAYSSQHNSSSPSPMTYNHRPDKGSW